MEWTIHCHRERSEGDITSRRFLDADDGRLYVRVNNLNAAMLLAQRSERSASTLTVKDAGLLFRSLAAPLFFDTPLTRTCRPSNTWQLPFTFFTSATHSCTAYKRLHRGQVLHPLPPPPRVPVKGSGTFQVHDLGRSQPGTCESRPNRSKVARLLRLSDDSVASFNEQHPHGTAGVFSAT